MSLAAHHAIHALGWLQPTIASTPRNRHAYSGISSDVAAIWTASRNGNHRGSCGRNVLTRTSPIRSG